VVPLRQSPVAPMRAVHCTLLLLVVTRRTPATPPTTSMLLASPLGPAACCQHQGHATVLLHPPLLPSKHTPNPQLLRPDPQLLLPLTSSRSVVVVCCSPVSGSAGVSPAGCVEVTGCPSASLPTAVMGSGASVQWAAAAGSVAESAPVCASVALLLVC
jgi:hypothetical protein